MAGIKGMLFPPLEDEPVARDDVGESKNNGPQVLSQDLRDRFSKVRSLLRQQSTAEDTAVELRQKQEQAALATAQAVQDEVMRLQNGIAELEAMYDQQQPQPAVFDDDDDDDDSDDGEGHDIKVGAVADDQQQDNGEPHHRENHRRNEKSAAILFPDFPYFSANAAVVPDLDTASIRSSHSSTSNYDKGAEEVNEDTDDILCNVHSC